MPEPKSELILRRMVWMHHNCGASGAIRYCGASGAIRYMMHYGSDGEMQCENCLIDFKREDPAKIEARLGQLAADRLRLSEEYCWHCGKPNEGKVGNGPAEHNCCGQCVGSYRDRCPEV